MGIEIRMTAGGCALAMGAAPLIAVALLITAPSALADPAVQPPPAPPAGAVPPPAGAVPPPAGAVPPPAGAQPQAAATDTGAPPDGMPHLMSPQNLPPGTTATPDNADSPRMSYLRELWQAVHSNDISKRDALLLLTQRPLDADSTPPPGMEANPQSQGPVASPPGAAAPPPGPAAPPPAPTP